MKQLMFITSAAIITATSGIAEGNAEDGERLFRRCAACHAIEPGQRKSGPHLQAIVGREAATVEGYRYSPAMTDAGLIWDEETLRAFLADPRGYVPRTKMSFPGITDETDLDDLIAYLSEL